MKKGRRIYFRTDGCSTLRNVSKSPGMRGFIAHNWDQMVKSFEETNPPGKRKYSLPGNVTVNEKLWKDILAVCSLSRTTEYITIVLDGSGRDFVNIRMLKDEGKEAEA